MSTLLISGTPLARFTFDYIPSWNDAVAKARGRFGWRSGHAHTVEWRIAGYDLARRFMEEIYPLHEYLFEAQTLVVVKLYRATARKYDVHNVYTKALFDGFTSAKIWPDDDSRHVPCVVYLAMPYDGAGQRVEIDLHEFGGAAFERVAQDNWWRELL